MRGGCNLLKLLSRTPAVLSGPEAGHKCPAIIFYAPAFILPVIKKLI